MENIGLKFKVIHLSLFLIIGAGFISSLVFAYSPYYTHPDLTEEIAKLWNLKNNNKDLKILQNEIEWMREGAIDEDTPARWINHFYDPINNVGWQGKHFGTLSQAEGLYSGESMAPKKAISSINWATNQEYQATYGRQYGNQTWQKAINSYIDNDRKSAFIALGHILHLIEDASVPDHTRNDTHADLYGDTASPYEEYTKNYTNFNKLTIAENLKNKTLRNFSTIQDAFDYIANYSNNNFFSKDTISNEEFNSPDLKNLLEKGDYLYDEKNDIYLAQYKYERNKIFYTLNDKSLILPSYFTHLAPQAVSTGAGVLNLFFQEVERYKKNPELLPEIIPDSNEATLSYLKKSPRLMAVNIGDTIDKTSTNSQIFLAKVSDAVVATYDSATNLISRFASTEVSPNNNSASVLLATTQNTQTTQNTALTAPKTESPLQKQQDTNIPNPLSIQIPTTKSAASLPAPLSTPTTKSLVVGVLSGVSYGGGGASPQAQQETQQTAQQEAQQSTTTPDTTLPIITILGDNPTTTTLGTIYIDGGATALDDIDGVREVTATSTVNTLIAGTYAVTYTATDLSGNTATSTRVVNVIATKSTAVTASELTDNFLYSDLNNNSIADSDESVVLVDANRTLPAGAYRFNNLIIASTSVLTLEGNVASTDSFRGVKISAVNLTINTGSSISADGQGYDGSGIGFNEYSSTASYGGIGGGNTATSTYGSAIKPVDLGSGVYNYRGGGAIRLVVEDTFLNDGSISANGGGYRSSGGSVYINAHKFTGAGALNANGSHTSWPYMSAGGGGRIAVYYDQSSFSGTAKASAGVLCFYGCNPAGGTGTVAFFDVPNNDFYAGSSWRFQKNDEPLSFNRINILNGASVTMDEGVAITANELVVNKTTTLPLSKGSLLAIHKITLDGGTVVSSGEETIIADTLVLTNSAVFTVEQMQTLTLSIPLVTVNDGSSISVDAKGNSAGIGFPPASSGGGSYGGAGYNNTATSTSIYGSAVKPVDFGSAGGAPHSLGGGAIRLIVSGMLVNDGVISANGNTSASGGSIYITAKDIMGTGAFRANGGGIGVGGYFSGPGGGGRIALYYQTYSLSGKVETSAGCGSYDGWSMTCAENGTVGLFDTTNNDLIINSSWRFQKNDGPFSFNHITITNGATVSVEDGAKITASEILVDKGSSLTLLGNASLAIPMVTLDGGSTLTISGSEILNINTLVVKGNSNITVDQGQILSLSVANLTIDSGSYISANEKGYGYGAGPGASSSDWQNATYYAGASYGGVGAGNTATSTYGSVTEPVDFGSGGNGYNPHGGGAIRIIVTDNFIHNGNIYANGSNTSSGGSIFVTTNKIEGNGSFHADGGGGYYQNNPGGGGRIAIYYQSSVFTGLSFAPGGGCLGCSGGVGGSGSTLMEQIGSGTTNSTVSTTTSDTLAPIITSLSFSTSTGYAKIGDIITLTISADDAGYSLGTTTVNGVAVADFTDLGAGAYTAIYTVGSGDNDRVSGSIPASVILVDSAGNASVPFTTVDTNTLKLDANIPVLLSALVISTTTVDVLFSEDLNGSTITNKDFSITGNTLATPDAFEVSDGLVRLTVNVPFGAGETPEIFYNTTVSNGVKDLAGNIALAGSVLASSGVW